MKSSAGPVARNCVSQARVGSEQVAGDGRPEVLEQFDAVGSIPRNQVEVGRIEVPPIVSPSSKLR